MMQETVPLKESLGKVNISPSQVALIVDNYLCANNLSHTRATFRMEASSLFSGSPFNQVCKPSLNLGRILEDYISLKRQNLILNQENLILNQERVAMMQEQFRVQKLVQDVQNVVNAYHTFQRLIPVADKTPSGVCTGMDSVQNTNTDNKVQWQQSHKRKNSEAIDAPTIAKKPRGRPPGKKNQFKGLNMLPSVGTQSLIANSTVTRSQVPTNSSIIETHPGTATNKSVTTCNKDVVTHSETVMVCPDEEITYKPNLHSSPINSDTETKKKSELVCNASHVLLEDSIPNEFSIPHKETQKEQSDTDTKKKSELVCNGSHVLLENSIPNEFSIPHQETQEEYMDLSHISFPDLDTEYWSNFSSKDIGIFNEDFFYLSTATHVHVEEVDA
ncbi:uncharacterized protein LOC114162704 [Vigna unguiculata]|uniref:uncharacterized protein LOC114162704 n=1 Tax=Vigna unguiculata TaxID=3917 RepID=UPI001016019B|nr:uncharacterized protein LOC114162704 [Vigna unguiculata]